MNLIFAGATGLSVQFFAVIIPTDALAIGKSDG
jgi:hypothetical protein